MNWRKAMDRVLDVTEHLVNDDFEGVERPIVPDAVYYSIVAGACLVIGIVVGLLAATSSLWL